MEWHFCLAGKIVAVGSDEVAVDAVVACWIVNDEFGVDNSDNDPIVIAEHFGIVACWIGCSWNDFM